jgi:hypothetical protein
MRVRAILGGVVAAGAVLAVAAPARADIVDGVSKCGTHTGTATVTHGGRSSVEQVYKTRAVGASSQCVVSIKKELNAKVCAPGSALPLTPTFDARLGRAVNLTKGVANSRGFRVDGSPLPTGTSADRGFYAFINATELHDFDNVFACT